MLHAILTIGDITNHDMELNVTFCVARFSGDQCSGLKGDFAEKMALLQSEPEFSEKVGGGGGDVFAVFSL